MSKTDLVSSLSGWVREALTYGPEHCVDLHPRVRIPGAGLVDLVSLRHEADRFGIGLWSISTREAGDAQIDAMTRRIHAFEAWYSELRERAEVQGFSPSHRVFVCGNIVAPAVRRSPIVNLLSTRGASICFWTWTRSAAGFEVAPFYGKCPVSGSSRRQFRELLPHLSWKDVATANRVPRLIPT